MNTKPEEPSENDREILLGVAARMVQTLYAWNVMDIPELVRDDGVDSVYHHQDKALKRLLRHLGVKDDHAFYRSVLDGATPVEALEIARASQ